MQAKDLSTKTTAKFVIGTLIVLGFTIGAGRALSATAGDEAIFETIIEIDLRHDAGVARSQGKHVMIMFVQDGCSACLKMKREVLTDPSVQAYFKNHFLSYDVNIFGDLPVIDQGGVALTEKTYAGRERIWGTPTFRFFGENGRLVYQHTGALSKADFVRLGEFVAAQRYRSAKSFQRADMVF